MICLVIPRAAWQPTQHTPCALVTNFINSVPITKLPVAGGLPNHVLCGRSIWEGTARGRQPQGLRGVLADEIGVQHMIRAFAEKLGVALD